MSRLGWILLLSLAMTGAHAQGTSGGVTMSTDPAKAAAIERHAQELKARQATETTSKPAATPKSSAKTKTKAKPKAKAKAPATHKSSAAKPAKSPKS